MNTTQVDRLLAISDRYSSVATVNNKSKDRHNCRMNDLALSIWKECKENLESVQKFQIKASLSSSMASSLDSHFGSLYGGPLKKVKVKPEKATFTSEEIESLAHYF